MWSLFERAKKVIFALVLSIIPLVLLYVQSRDDKIRSAVVWPITELAGAVAGGTLFVTGFVSDTLYRYLFLVNRTDELISLRSRVRETDALRAKVLDLEIENSKLKAMRSTEPTAHQKTHTIARVIARAGAPMARMVRIDRGSSDGIVSGSPVIAYEGAVGQVLTVAPHFSDILLLTDASSAIDAKIIGHDAFGLLRGITNSTEYLMEIRDVDGAFEINANDMVVTSGINSNFPHGIPIGHVLEATRSRDGLMVSARIKPFVKMDALVYVQILPSTKDASTVDPMKAQWPLAVQ